MSINSEQLAADLNALRQIAAERWDEDPLPVGNDARLRLKADIQLHDLHRHISELDVDGYTVVAPGKAGPAELIDQLRNTVLSLAESKRTNTMGQSGLGQTLFHMLPEDPVFERAVM